MGGGARDPPRWWLALDWAKDQPFRMREPWGQSRASEVRDSLNGMGVRGWELIFLSFIALTTSPES